MLPDRLSYNVNVEWDGETGGFARLEGEKEVRVDTPPEFRGRGVGYCPDELFITSVASCILTTFLYFKNKLKLDLKGLNVKAEMDVVREESGYWVRKMEIKVNGKVEKGQKEKFMKCLQLAKKYCNITRALADIGLQISGEAEE